MQTRSLVFGTLLVGGLILIAWQEYYRKSELLGAVGVSGPRGNSRRHCTGIYSNPRLRIFPRGMVSCRGESYMWGARSVEMVGVDPLSRKVVMAQHLLLATDSVHWAQERDSLTQNLERHGGRVFECRYAPDPEPPNTLTYWRFRNFFVVESAIGGQSPVATPWQINVFAASGAPRECLHPRRSIQSDESNPCEGAQFILPVGFGKAICWKAPPWA